MNWLARIWLFERWMIKLFLFIFFIFNLGLPQHMVKMAIEEWNAQPIDERMIRATQLNPFLDKLVERAERRISEGIPYSPYDYYTDSMQYYVKCTEHKLREHSPHQMRHLGWLMQSAITENKYTPDDLEKAKAPYKELIDPGRLPREKFVKDVQALGLNGVLKWFLWLYLKTLPLAFILFLVWAKDEQPGHKKFLLPKPLHFFMLWILYPLVFGICLFRWFRESGRRVYAETEVRRFKLFAFISESEQEKIQQFAKSNLSLAEWKKQLAEIGLKPKHSFAAALAVTLLFIIVIRPTEVCTKQAKDYAENLVLEQIATSQNLARMSIDDAKKIQPEKISSPWERAGDVLAVDSYDYEACLLQRYFGQKNILAPVAEFFRNIFHVPLQAVQFEVNIETQPQF